MPAVVWCAIGFVAGDIAGLLRSGAWWPAAPLLAAAAYAARGHARSWMLLTAGAAGALWGAAAASHAARDCRMSWREGERVAVVVRLWDVATPGGTSRVKVAGPERCAGPLWVRWPARALPPSAAAVVVGTWHRVGASGPLLGRRPERAGRLVALRVRPVALERDPRSSVRLATERRLARLFGERRAPLAAALTVAAQDQLDRATRQRFARAGLAHLLSISGLHVGILGAALLLLLRAGRVPDAPARLAGFALVTAYVFLLGLPAPAVRSMGLIGLWTWSRVRQRPLVPYAALAATALAVVALDPFAVTEAGPWLSFAGAFGCVRAARIWASVRRELPGPRHRAVDAALGVCVVSGGATLATAPVSVVAFGTMAPAALLSNVLAVPLAGVVMPALALTVVLGAVAPAAALWIAPVTAAGLDAVDLVARLAGALPLATVNFERRLLAAAWLGAVAWTLLGPASPRRGGVLPALRARATIAAALGAAAAAWWPAFPAAGSGYSTGRLALHFLAVGQGDAAAVRTPAGRWIVVDGGPRTVGYDAGASVVVPFLRRSGASPSGGVALVVATHGDADHLGGLPAVVRAFRPPLVLEPGEPLPRAGYRRWLAGVAEAGARWRAARAGDSVVVDGLVLRVLHPDSQWMERRLPANESSVVLSLEYGAFRALLPGDAGLAFEAGEIQRLPRADVLKVAHHGSLTATGPALLAAVQPRVCVVSAGPNRYGLPDPGLLAALARSGCAVFRTDADGTVTVETDGRAVRVRAGPKNESFISIRGQP